MNNVTTELKRWTSDELVDEAIKRSAADRPALRRLETMVLKARLAEIDDRSAAGLDYADPLP